MSTKAFDKRSKQATCEVNQGNLYDVVQEPPFVVVRRSLSRCPGAALRRGPQVPQPPPRSHPSPQVAAAEAVLRHMSPPCWPSCPPQLLSSSSRHARDPLSFCPFFNSPIRFLHYELLPSEHLRDPITIEA
ncbi:hypothetical protein CFC21_018349 [Triticum aestivum]|uniref:Uncharacterized protein n=1 Tax=Triticum aestivum TaxID=4565 RepID=A0A9R1J3S1_WHEAT|nr:hypothetical protein CFC21_018349 [Triticum aestivum]